MESKLKHHISITVKKGMILLLLICSFHSAQAQKGNRPPKNPEKVALKEEQKKAKQLDRDIRKVKKKHKKAQTKTTRKRMKTHRGKSGRVSRGQKDPFFQRLFNKRNYKKVKNEKE